MSDDSPTTGLRSVLAAVDLSPFTEAVLETAARMCGGQTRLWLLHVAAPEPEFVGFDPGPPSVRNDTATHYHDAHRRLQDHAAALRARGLDARALLVQGPTVQTIRDEAAKLEADLIVIGSHGHGAVYQTLVGSVGRGVLHGARRPVLVVPPGAHEGGGK
jgi:nucleotide-binding universal stress UspA family protein